MEMMKVRVRSAWLGTSPSARSCAELESPGDSQEEHRGEGKRAARRRNKKEKKKKNKEWHPGDLEKNQKEQGTKYQGCDS